MHRTTTAAPRRLAASRASRDRKSTRLNSSHLVISYAVFCLKKKKNIVVSEGFGDDAALAFHRAVPRPRADLHAVLVACTASQAQNGLTERDRCRPLACSGL